MPSHSSAYYRKMHQIAIVALQQLRTSSDVPRSFDAKKIFGDKWHNLFQAEVNRIERDNNLGSENRTIEWIITTRHFLERAKAAKRNSIIVWATLISGVIAALTGTVNLLHLFGFCL